MDEIEVPSYFLCPISLQIMKDPVTISTGITYDRENIEKWLSLKKNKTCPVTKQRLQENCDLTPNNILLRLIQGWCTMNASYGVERIPTQMDEMQIKKLIKDSKTPQLQIKCLQKIRSVASESETNKKIIEAAGGVKFLASLIVNARLSEEALSILCSLQISESSLKSLVVENVGFMESLIRVMQCGSYESRAYAVVLLQSMFEVVDSVR